MADGFILQGKVMWSYDHEMIAFTSAQKLISGLSGIGGPLHNHEGYIALTSEQILVEGAGDEDDLVIPLSSISQLYLGYDEVYTSWSVKNAGLFWQPLRLEYFGNNNKTIKIYVIIDYMSLYSHNQNWYDALT